MDVVQKYLIVGHTRWLAIVFIQQFKITFEGVIFIYHRTIICDSRKSAGKILFHDVRMFVKWNSAILGTTITLLDTLQFVLVRIKTNLPLQMYAWTIYFKLSFDDVKTLTTEKQNSQRSWISLPSNKYSFKED